MQFSEPRTSFNSSETGLLLCFLLPAVPQCPQCVPQPSMNFHYLSSHSAAKSSSLCGRRGEGRRRRKRTWEGVPLSLSPIVSVHWNKIITAIHCTYKAELQSYLQYRKISPGPYFHILRRKEICIPKSARLTMGRGVGGGGRRAEVCVSKSIVLAYRWKGTYVSNTP